MKNNIFVPKIINVGYQKRSDTFTGKLAYVVYTDEKGTLRKQASWDSWRDENIKPDTFDNTPTSGFVLNKKVGDTRSHWNFRQAYCRIYDPRGFEFEITIENLLYILENTNSIVGKGLEGEFVYGWDGKDLVLLPTNSPDYKEIQEFTNLMYSEKSITVKDLVVGYTYRGKDNCLYVYLGKYDEYSSVYPYNRPSTNKGKYLWFAKFNNEEEINQVSNNLNNLNQYIGTRKSISNKFLLGVQSESTFPYLSEFIDTLPHMPSFSPIDLDNIQVEEISKDLFIESVNKYLKKVRTGECWFGDLIFCSKVREGFVDNYKIKAVVHYNIDTHQYVAVEFALYRYDERHYSSIYYTYANNNKPIEIWKSLNESEILDLYNIYKPCCVKVFLKNGEFYNTYYEYLPITKEES